MDEGIREVIDILCDHAFDAAQLDEAVAYVRERVDDPELDWLPEVSRRIAFGIYIHLYEVAVNGDKLDEIHARLEDMFEERLPPFPHVLPKINGDEYFGWLDGLLRERGYALASLDFGDGDELHLFVIDRADSARLIALGDSLGLRLQIEAGA